MATAAYTYGWAGVRRGLRLELRPMLRLAGPVVLAELGWMAMGLVDTMMVGRVSAEAIGAVAIGSHPFYAVALFGMGMLFGLDYAVAHAFGAGKHGEAHRSLIHGLALSVMLSAVLVPLLWVGAGWLPLLGISDAVLEDGIPYFRVLTLSLLPLLVFTALRRYLQAFNHVQPIMVAMVSANLINLVADWVLIFGHFGAPALGAVGAGWATLFSRIYMLVVLVLYTVRHARRHDTGLLRTPLRIEIGRLWELLRLGLPASFQMLLEAGVFTAATLLAGVLDAASLAAHQIALSAAAFTFMVPLGVSSAAAVRVGQGLGRRDPDAAERAGWTAVAVGATFMLCAGLMFVLVPHAILRIFTTQPAVMATGVSLLLVAALFQLSDGVQVITTGALRGSGDTRTPMLSCLVAHWLVGLPIGSALCFWLDWGVVGLWVGLSLGLTGVAVVLLWVWSRRIGHIAGQPLAPKLLGRDS